MDSRDADTHLTEDDTPVKPQISSSSPSLQRSPTSVAQPPCTTTSAPTKSKISFSVESRLLSQSPPHTNPQPPVSAHQGLPPNHLPPHALPPPTLALPPQATPPTPGHDLTSLMIPRNTGWRYQRYHPWLMHSMTR